MTIAFLFILSFQENWRVQVDQFQNLAAKGYMNVACSSEGDVFVLDVVQKTVKHFDAMGKPLPDISRKGGGPGEINNFASNITAFGNRLYINEPFAKLIHVYDAKGKFLKDVSCPSFGASPVPMDEAWYYWEEHFQDSNTVKLFFTDMQLGNPKEFFSWEKPPRREDYLNIAMETPLAALGPDHKTVYLYNPDSTSLTIIVDGQATGEIPFSIPRLSFEEAWGEAEWKKRSKIRQMSHYKGVIFPDYFPRVKAMHIDPTGQIWLTPGTALMNPEVAPIPIALDGSTASPKIKHGHDIRFFAAHGNNALVTWFDEDGDEGASIASIPFEQLDAFLAKLP